MKCVGRSHLQIQEGLVKFKLLGKMSICDYAEDAQLKEAREFLSWPWLIL